MSNMIGHFIMNALELEKLKDYFKNKKEVAFAFLFGSQAKGNANELSDVDIAVYFYPDRRYPLEYEGNIRYPTEDRIWTDLERILNEEVDLLVLNRASISVAASAIRGIPLGIKDWNLYLYFMEIVTREAEDFREMLFRDFIERDKFARGI